MPDDFFKKLPMFSKLLKSTCTTNLKFISVRKPHIKTDRGNTAKRKTKISFVILRRRGRDLKVTREFFWQQSDYDTKCVKWSKISFVPQKSGKKNLRTVICLFLDWRWSNTEVLKACVNPLNCFQQFVTLKILVILNVKVW